MIARWNQNGISESVIDLYQYKGHSAVIVGDHLPVEAQAVALHKSNIRNPSCFVRNERRRYRKE